MSGDPERAVRESLEYRPWRCNQCRVQFLSLEDARLHFLQPFSRHPGLGLDVTELIDHRKEIQVHLRLQELRSQQTGQTGHSWDEVDSGQPSLGSSEPQARPAPMAVDASQPPGVPQTDLGPHQDVPSDLDDLHASTLLNFHPSPGLDELADAAQHTATDQRAVVPCRVVLVDLAGREDGEEAKRQLLSALDGTGHGLQPTPAATEQSTEVRRPASPSGPDRTSTPVPGPDSASAATSDEMLMAEASIDDSEGADGGGDEDGTDAVENAATEDPRPSHTKHQPRSKAKAKVRAGAEAPSKAPSKAPSPTKKTKSAARKSADDLEKKRQLARRRVKCSECGDWVRVDCRLRHVARKHCDETVFACPLCAWTSKDTHNMGNAMRHMKHQHHGEPQVIEDRRAQLKARYDRLQSRCFP